MKFSPALNKLLPFRQKQDAAADEAMTTPPLVDGLVKLQTTQTENLSVRAHKPKPVPGSRSASAPASVGRTPTPGSPIDDRQRPVSSNGAHRRLQRARTVELVCNRAYRPTGGPEYVKLLAKYNLLENDPHQGLVVVRVVNAGRAIWRKPEVIKVNQFSANGNQEFLAEITIGTSTGAPQSKSVSESQLLTMCSSES